jgi:hypothetical protein
MPLSERAKHGLALLDADGIGDRPILFITHSMGGLLVKQMIRHGIDLGDVRWKAIADRTKGVCFIATPHSGADLANYIKFLTTFLATVAVSDLKANDSRLMELNQWYRHHAFTRFKTEVYCERKVTGWKGLGVIVVDERSADPGLPGVVPVPLDEDHLSICKPASRENLLYKRVRRFVKENLISTRSGSDHPYTNSATSTIAGRSTGSPAKQFGVPNIPDLPFLGREANLQDLKERLGIASSGAPAAGVPRLVAVRGWPGVGKTSIVLRLAHESDVLERFCDGVVWTSLGEDVEASMLIDKIARCCQHFGSSAALAARKPAEASEELMDLLRHKQVLLIVDDVWDLEDAAFFQKATPPFGALLITTRERRTAEDLARDNVCHLPELEENDALELLDRLAPGLVTQYRNLCTVLIRNLGCLPLGIHVAGMMMARERGIGLDVEGLLAELCADTSMILTEKAPTDRVDLDGYVRPTVQYILQRSVERLEVRTRFCFACLSMFPPKPNTFGLAAMQAMWGASDSEAKSTVRELVARGLLEPVGGYRYQMHDLLLALARRLVR